MITPIQMKTPEHSRMSAGSWIEYAYPDPYPNIYDGEVKGLAEIPFIRRGDSAYVIVEGPTWEEAEANAVALGGHLVTINNAEENDMDS